MSVFFALLKRERLEHRSGFFWAPVILLLLILLLGMTLVVARDNMEVVVTSQGAVVEDSGVAAVSTLFFDLATMDDVELTYRLNRFFGVMGVPFYWLLTAVSLFTLVASVYDERRDQTVLFWKSMPVPDLTTVISKLVFVTWVGPILTIIGTCLAYVMVLVLASAFVAEGGAQQLWSAAELGIKLPQLVVGYALHGLWVLPIYTWFLLVGTLLTRAPLLWAAGLPLIVVIVERILLGSEVFSGWLGAHVEPYAIPWLSSASPAYDLLGNFRPWAVLTMPTFWQGLLVAGVLLTAAVFMRGRCNEI